MPKLKFLRQRIEVTIPSGSEFIEVARKSPELPLKFGCTRGYCGTCAIKVLLGSGNLTKQSLEEIQLLKNKQLDPYNYRLACQCAINGDVLIE